MRATIIDINVEANESSNIVITLKEENNNTSTIIDTNYKPYFYLILKDDNYIRQLNKDIHDLKIIDTEVSDERKNNKQILKYVKTNLDKLSILSGEYKILRVYFNKIEDLINAREKLKNLSYISGMFEYDIPYIQRYMIDKKIKPMHSYEIDKNNLSFSGEKTDIEYNSLALDIETEPVKNVNPKIHKIRMISLYDPKQKIKKVIAYKKPKKKISYLKIVKDEREMILETIKIIKNSKTHNLITYNGDNFDLPFLKTRSRVLGIQNDFDRVLNFRVHTRANQTTCKTKGINHIDAYRMVRHLSRIGAINLVHLKLTDVYEFLFDKKKEDIPYSRMEEYYNDDTKLSKLIEYNLEDSICAYKIADNYIMQYINLGQITGKTIADAIRASSSVLVESLLMRKTIQDNKIIPSMPKDSVAKGRDENSFVGGYVKEPVAGLHKDIVVVDFDSFHPSIIISYNISSESLDEENCIDFEESPIGDKFCQDERATIPQILEQIFDSRMEIKTKMKELSKSSIEYKKMFAHQWTLKILLNSMYGYLAYTRSRWYCFECARSTLKYTHKFIHFVIDSAREFDLEPIYGDSLHPERKIFIVDDKNNVRLVKIGKFVDNNLENKNIEKFKTLSYDGDKITHSKIKRVIRHKYNKNKGNLIEFNTTNGKTVVTPEHSVYVYDNGIKLKDAKEIKIGDYLISFNDVPNIINYDENTYFDLAKLNYKKYNDKLYLYPDTLKFPKLKDKEICPYCGKKRILYTHINNKHRDRIKPLKEENCSHKFIGGKTSLRGKIPRYWKLNEDLAWLMGYYASDGSASERNDTRKKSMISFGSQNKDTIERIKKIMDNIIKGKNNIIKDYDKRINKNMYYYRVQRYPIVPLFIYGFDLGKKPSGKRVPYFILNASENIKRAFLEGYFEGDGLKYKDPRYKTHFQKFSTKSQDLAIGLQYLLKSLKDKDKNHFGKSICNIYWNFRKDKKDIVDLRYQSVKGKEYKNFCKSRVREISKLEYDGYVYDIEVENSHNFLDSEGLILVHNTDSAFLKYKNKEDVINFLKFVNSKLPRKINLSLEGYFKRGIFVSKKDDKGSAKKRYALIDNKGKMKITGFETVRHDWSEIAKRLQKNVIRSILERGDTKDALKMVQKEIKDIQEGNAKLKDLVIINRIKKPLDSYSSTSPQVSAAIKANKKGYKFGVGDLVEYIITNTGTTISDKAEIYDISKEMNYDKEYYINNQILPAIRSIFKVFDIDDNTMLKEPSQKKLF